MPRGYTANTSVKKQAVPYGNLPSFGARNVEFYHKAVAGENLIDLTALTMPPELTTKGYVNPTVTVLNSLNISANKSNLSIRSSIRGLLMKLSYNVPNGTQITFDGWTTSEGEIFECSFEPYVVTGTNIVDARPLVQTYLLPAGQQSVAVEDFEYFKFPTKQLGAVMVFRGVSPVLQLRNTANATASLSADGNYQEVATIGGVCREIKFNVPAASGGEPVVIVSVGSLVERPTQSMLSYLESLSGVQSRIIDVLSDVSGQPTSYFDAVPTSVDLLNFAERVYTLENRAVVVGQNALGTSLPNNIQTVIPFTITTDTHGMYSGGTITAARSGLLSINASIRIAGNTGWEALEAFSLLINKGVSTIIKIKEWQAIATQAGSFYPPTLSVSLLDYPVVANETFNIQAFQNSDGAIALVTTGYYNTLEVSIK